VIRKIYWLWSTKGNTGKSSFCKHLVLKYGAIVVNGRPEDAYFAIIQRLSPIKKNKKIDDSDDRKVNIICFDLCRSEKNNISYVGKCLLILLLLKVISYRGDKEWDGKCTV
jgi:hypothetical protein